MMTITFIDIISIIAIILISISLIMGIAVVCKLMKFDLFRNDDGGRTRDKDERPRDRNRI